MPPSCPRRRKPPRRELKARGVDTIVDLTVIGLGRYLPRIARIAAQTDLDIVVATGLYTFDDVPMYFHYRGPGAPLGGPELMTDKPALEQLGVTAEQITTMLVDNPRRIFSVQGGY